MGAEPFNAITITETLGNKIEVCYFKFHNKEGIFKNHSDFKSFSLDVKKDKNIIYSFYWDLIASIKVETINNNQGKVVIHGVDSDQTRWIIKTDYKATLLLALANMHDEIRPYDPSYKIEQKLKEIKVA